MHRSSLSIVGNTSDSSWSGVAEYSPGNELEKRLGNLYVSISLNGVDSTQNSKRILSIFRDTYYTSDASAFNSLAKAVSAALLEAESLGLLASISAASCVGKTVYSSAVGGAKVAIRRSGSLTPILSSESEIVSASGYPQVGDVILLGTESFFEIADFDFLRGFRDNSPQGLVEEVAPKLHTVDDSSKASALVVVFSDSVPEDLPSTGSPVEVIEEKKRLLDRLKSPKIYVNRPEEIEVKKSKKTAMSVGIILIILLVVSIGFGSRKRSESEYKEAYESRLSQASHEYEEAIALYDVSPERSREHFWESKNTVEGLVSEGFDDPEIVELKSKLDDVEGKILGEYKTDLREFLDLSLLSDGFVGSDIAASTDTIAVLDKSSEKAIRTNYEAKDTSVVAGPSALDSPVNIATFGDRVYVQMDSGIYEVDESSDLKIEKTWDGEGLFSAYSGNIYLLDRTTSDIIRFSGIGTGFASGKSWLREGSDPDLSKIRSMAIDGSIWLLNNQGKLFKFSLGNQVNFSLSGIAPEMTSPKEVYTNDELDGIYMLDSDNSRVVVVDKEGVFLAQYTSEGIKDAKDIAVSEEEKRVVLLIGDKLMKFEIRHL